MRNTFVTKSIRTSLEKRIVNALQSGTGAPLSLFWTWEAGILNNYGDVSFYGYGNSLLEKRDLILVGAHSEFKTKISYRKARMMVLEQAAEIITPNTIQLVMSNSELKQFILWRDRSTCQQCGDVGNHVVRLVPKSYGGLPTPQNQLVLCDECKTLRDIFFSVNLKRHCIAGVPCLTNHRDSQPNHVTCYSDISADPIDHSLFGIAITVVASTRCREQAAVFTKAARLSSGTNTSVAEAEAVLLARKIGLDIKSEEVHIYSDIDFSQMAHPKSHYMEKLLQAIITPVYPQVKVEYLPPHRQEVDWYQAAHRYARWAVRKYRSYSAKVNARDNEQ